jgi:hypothetical protein
MSKFAGRLWLARLLIAIVIAWNLLTAFYFLVDPDAYVSAFELSGVPGSAVLRSVAVLFVMWNVPYLVAFWQPSRYRLSLWEALAMQALGVLGEIFILFTLPPGHTLLVDSLLRFITFDAIGLPALGAALILTKTPLEHLAKPLA